MRRLVVRAVTPPLLAACALVACSSQAPATKSDAGAPNSATLASNAHAVQTPPTSVAASAVTFPENAETSSLAVGDVIAAATRIDTPYLVRIAAIQKANGVVTFKTEPASMTDLFQEVHFSQTVNLDDPNALDTSQSYRLGELHTDGVSLTGPPVGGDKQWMIPGVAGKFACGGTGSIDTTESYLNLHGGVEFNMDYGVLSGLTELKLALQGTLTARLGATAAIRGRCSYTLPLKTWYDQPFATFWFQAGPIPVPVVMSLQLNTTATVTFQDVLQLHEATTVSIAIEEGAEYANGSWGAVNNHMFNVTNDPLTVSGNNGTVLLTFSPLAATFLFSPFNVAGPTVSLSPYIGVTGAFGTGASEIDGRLGAKLAIGGAVEILHHDLGKFSYPFADFSDSFVLWKASQACKVAGGATLGPAWCNEAALQSCATGIGSTSCFNKSGTCSTAGISNGPANEDVVCNSTSLLQCLCLAGPKPMTDAGVDAAGASDAGSAQSSCFSQHCSPCAQNALACKVPN